MNTARRYATIGTALGFLMIGWTGSSFANYTFTTCGITCEADCDDPGSSGSTCHEAEGGRCQLVADVSSSSTTVPCIRAQDGTNIDLNGHTVTCAANVECVEAVRVENTGTKVWNTDGGQALITGGWSDGVNCGLYASTEVSGIKIHNTLVGVRDCKTVKNNVITGLGRTFWTGNWGVSTNGVTTNGDLISKNYIADKSSNVLIAGTDAVEVSENVMHTSTWSNCGVNLTSGSAEAVVLGNVIMGVGNVGFGSIRKIVCLTATPPPNVDISGNICDQDHPDCATCQANEHCSQFTAPFEPW